MCSTVLQTVFVPFASQLTAALPFSTRTSSNTPLPSHSGHLSKTATYLRRQGSRRKEGSNYCLSIAHHKTFSDSNNYTLFYKYFWISVRKFLPDIGIRLFWRDNGSLYLDTLFPSVPPSEEGKQSFVTHLGHHVATLLNLQHFHVQVVEQKTCSM